MKYFMIFSRLLDNDRSVIHHILRAGYRAGEHPRAILKIANYHRLGVYAPSCELVVASDIAEYLISQNVAARDSFARFSKVESYVVDTINYPRHLDEYTTRDDIESVVWKKLPSGERVIHPVFEFTPKVLTYPEMQSRSDFHKQIIEYNVNRQGASVRECITIRWSPSMIVYPDCYWVDGCYMVPPEFMEKIDKFLTRDIWEAIEIDI